MQNSFEIEGKFLGTGTRKTLDNGKDVSSFYLDVTDNVDYPNCPEFNLYDLKCDLVNDLKKGDKIKVTFNIAGKKYTNKTTGKTGVFTNLQTWKIEKIQEEEVDDLGF